MITEGIGKKTPRKIKYVCPMDTVRANMRIISARAVRQSDERGYRDRPDAWGKGMGGKRRGELTVDQTSIFAGLMGEHATKDYLSAQGCFLSKLDLRSRPYGDTGCDFVARNVWIQVKTRQSLSPVMLVREDHRRPVPRGITLVYLCVEYPMDRNDTLSLCGWIYAADIERHPLEQSKYGHSNRVIPDDSLSPMSGLVTLIKAMGRHH